MLCNHHLYLVLKHFITKENPVSIKHLLVFAVLKAYEQFKIITPIPSWLRLHKHHLETGKVIESSIPLNVIP